MSGGKFHVHGPHDHAVEHAGGDHGSGGGLTQSVAIFTAILATIGAIVSYQGGHTQNEALYYKNEAVLKKTDAANQWSYYQGKSTKQNLAELAEALGRSKAQMTAIIDALEARELWQPPELRELDGLDALKQGGPPGELMRRTKETLFAW